MRQQLHTRCPVFSSTCSIDVSYCTHATAEYCSSSKIRPAIIMCASQVLWFASSGIFAIRRLFCTTMQFSEYKCTEGAELIKNSTGEVRVEFFENLFAIPHLFSLDFAIFRDAIACASLAHLFRDSAGHCDCRGVVVLLD